MEMYFHPGENAVVIRDEMLRLFKDRGIEVSAAEEDKFWVVEIKNTSAFVNFQEKDGKLCYASLDMSMLGEFDQSHAVFALLEDHGWESEEDVG